MRYTLLVVFFLFKVVLGFSQSTIVSGKIVSGNNPVVGATVNVKALKQFVITDSLGNFECKGDLPAAYQIHVSAAGYVSKTVKLNKTSYSIVIELDKNEQDLAEVVVSGTMRTVSKMASPIVVEVYSPQYFKKNQVPNIFESMQMINGVQPQLNCNVCNTGDIHINGMEGPYTMILIDGMPIVSSLSTVYGLAGIPMSLVKRIEVVKGPASTLYGSEAVGGLINIITKDAMNADKLQLDFSATSVGEFNTDITAAINKKNYATIFGINQFVYDNRRDINNDNFTDITLQKRLSLFNKWSIQLPQNNTASWAARFFTENRWGGEMQWQPIFKGTDVVYGETITTNRFELIGNVSFKKLLQVDLSYNYHQQDSYYGKFAFNAKQQVAFLQLRYNKKIGQHQLLAGLPLRYTMYNDNTLGTANQLGKDAPANTFLPGIFLQDEWQCTNSLTILSGLRFDYHNTHGPIYTPRLSFKFSPNPNNTFRLGIGNGFRVVNLFTEDHAALTGARKVVISNTLKPEKSWNVNINYSKQMVSKFGFFTVDISGFFTRFSNKIVADYSTDVTKILYDNLQGYAISKGITVNTSFNATNGLKLNAGATLMKVYQVENMGNKKMVIPQLYAPAIAATFAASYLIKQPNINVDITARVTGPMQLPILPNDFRSSLSNTFAIVNVQFTKPIHTNIELFGGAKNILNFIPTNPIIHADDPFNKAGGKYFDDNGVARPDTNPNGYVFDANYNYAAIQGAKVYFGCRWVVK